MQYTPRGKLSDDARSSILSCSRNPRQEKTKKKKVLCSLTRFWSPFFFFSCRVFNYFAAWVFATAKIPGNIVFGKKSCRSSFSSRESSLFKLVITFGRCFWYSQRTREEDASGRFTLCELLSSQFKLRQAAYRGDVYTCIYRYISIPQTLSDMHVYMYISGGGRPPVYIYTP